MGRTGSADQQAWIIINIDQLNPRAQPVLSQISQDELCILGGGDRYKESDGVILNVKTQEVTAINPASQIQFRCHSESFIEKQGLLLSLVGDRNDSVRLIRYS